MRGKRAILCLQHDARWLPSDACTARYHIYNASRHNKTLFCLPPLPILLLERTLPLPQPRRRALARYHRAATRSTFIAWFDTCLLTTLTTILPRLHYRRLALRIHMTSFAALHGVAHRICYRCYRPHRLTAVRATLSLVGALRSRAFSLGVTSAWTGRLSIEERMGRRGTRAGTTVLRNKTHLGRAEHHSPAGIAYFGCNLHLVTGGWLGDGRGNGYLLSLPRRVTVEQCVEICSFCCQGISCMEVGRQMNK